MTRIDEQKTKNMEERENIDAIPTQIEMIRSEHSSTSKCAKHGPKVNSDPDLPPPDLSDSSSSSDSERKRKKVKIRKSVVSIEKMTRQTRPPVMTLMTLIHLRAVIIDVDDAIIRNIGRRNRSDHAQL